jgi:hypothetical protein
MRVTEQRRRREEPYGDTRGNGGAVTLCEQEGRAVYGALVEEPSHTGASVAHSPHSPLRKGGP